MNQAFIKEAVFEVNFWMQILGDHSRFIFESLSSNEEKRISTAKYFISSFDKLLGASNQSLHIDELQAVIQSGIEEGERLRAFKLDIIKQHLVGKVGIQLPPSFISHMVNELEEWLRVASYLVKGNSVPPTHALHHHLLWLLDAAGHAGAIADNLDRVEKDLKEKGQEYTKQWEDFYLKAVELVGYLRTNQFDFPALSRFNNQVELEMTIFKGFLNELEEMELNKELLGVLTPLMADHMAREECYYLTKLSQSTKDVKPPACDPTKPRTNV
ncbi:DUF2935 domain-containing protein [Litchfieldia salsa]|uniref:DUF2935 domain-containing protein n=1 Tax=Litchfieldia salsa TaxID=930152 RepID=A0A1H0WGF6_9BACI|nr:DUF2935 domain-containing protein [Litchfieldia salsa]SDP89737.1 protein of unknown function [Litchfieldia salsa]